MEKLDLYDKDCLNTDGKLNLYEAKIVYFIKTIILVRDDKYMFVRISFLIAMMPLYVADFQQPISRCLLPLPNISGADILCDFPSSGVFCFVVDRVLTWEILEGISFVNWDGKEPLDTVSQ